MRLSHSDAKYVCKCIEPGPKRWSRVLLDFHLDIVALSLLSLEDRQFVVCPNSSSRLKMLAYSENPSIILSIGDLSPMVIPYVEYLGLRPSLLGKDNVGFRPVNFVDSGEYMNAIEDRKNLLSGLI